MLEAKDISFRYGSKLIIDNVSIRVEPGELLVILGANGAGKSTLIKILCGFLKPCSGIVEYDGKNIFGNSAKWLARKRAVLEQSSTCAFDLKVREIVELGLYAAEGAFSKIPNGREIAEISLEKAGLYGFAHRKYFELSGKWNAKVFSKISGKAKTFLFSPLPSGRFAELLAVGSDAYSIYTGQDMSDIRAKNPGNYVLQGNLDPMLLSVATPAEVERETLKILSAQKRFGRHIFNLGHGILPDAKIENVEAMRKCVAEFK